jgi:hypothetical protein
LLALLFASGGLLPGAAPTGGARLAEAAALGQGPPLVTPTSLPAQPPPNPAGAGAGPFATEPTPMTVAPATAPGAIPGTGTGAAPAAIAPAEVLGLTPTVAPLALVTVTPTPQPVVLSSTCANPNAAAAPPPAPAVVSAPAVMPAPIMPGPFPPLPFGPPFPLLGGIPGLPVPGMPVPGVLPAALAPAPAPAPPAATNNAPVLSCVNTAVGVALSWTPLRPAPGPVTYTVFRCDRTASPGQPGCESIFTTDRPTLFGPVTLGADYAVQVQSGSNLYVVSNRVPL